MDQVSSKHFLSHFKLFFDDLKDFIESFNIVKNYYDWIQINSWLILIYIKINYNNYTCHTYLLNYKTVLNETAFD